MYVCVSADLEMTEDLPSDELLSRWVAEPVRAICVPSSVFLSNKKGFPVLSKRHQAFIQKMFVVRACVPSFPRAETDVIGLA